LPLHLLGPNAEQQVGEHPANRAKSALKLIELGLIQVFEIECGYEMVERLTSGSDGDL